MQGQVHRPGISVVVRLLLSEGAIKETSACAIVCMCNSKVLVMPYAESVRELEKYNRSRLN
jgi:hypothetical protein